MKVMLCKLREVVKDGSDNKTMEDKPTTELDNDNKEAKPKQEDKDVNAQKLIQQLRYVLPMNDPLFLAKLRAIGLLPGNMKAEMKSVTTTMDQAKHFLKHMILPDFAANTAKIQKLLTLIEDHNPRLTRQLISSIRNEVKTLPMSEDG